MSEEFFKCRIKRGGIFHCHAADDYNSHPVKKVKLTIDNLNVTIDDPSKICGYVHCQKSGPSKPLFGKNIKVNQEYSEEVGRTASPNYSESASRKYSCQRLTRRSRSSSWERYVYTDPNRIGRSSSTPPQRRGRRKMRRSLSRKRFSRRCSPHRLRKDSSTSSSSSSSSPKRSRSFSRRRLTSLGRERATTSTQKRANWGEYGYVAETDQQSDIQLRWERETTSHQERPGTSYWGEFGYGEGSRWSC